MKRVPSTVVIGPRGEHMVTRGYTEIGGLRFYEDQMIVGPRGEPMIDKGHVELASGPSERFVKLTRNPELPRPARFEPTVKREGDVVL